MTILQTDSHRRKAPPHRGYRTWVLLLTGVWIVLWLVSCTAATPPPVEHDGGDGLSGMDASVWREEPPTQEREEEVQAEQGEPHAEGDTGASETPAQGPCQETSSSITCAHRQASLTIDGFVKTKRTVYWQVPAGTPPAGGWPVAVMFQGSFFSSKLSWQATKNAPFGGYHQTQTLQRLLEGGFAVLTPLAQGEGSTFWNTNVPPYAFNWSIAPDHALMKALFAAIEQGEFGPLNTKAMFAFGISSGGYMTSRMAVSYTERFRALAILAGSYATCGGVACVIPSLPKAHPPTLFLHGALDAVVPLYTAEAYHKALQKQNTPTAIQVDQNAGHVWISEAPALILQWFQKHK